MRVLLMVYSLVVSYSKISIHRVRSGLNHCFLMKKVLLSDLMKNIWNDISMKSNREPVLTDLPNYPVGKGLCPPLAPLRGRWSVVEQNPMLFDSAERWASLIPPRYILVQRIGGIHKNKCDSFLVTCWYPLKLYFTFIADLQLLLKSLLWWQWLSSMTWLDIYWSSVMQHKESYPSTMR